MELTSALVSALNSAWLDEFLVWGVAGMTAVIALVALVNAVDVFLDNGYTKEEMKMTNETKKIMGDDSIAVTATTVRIPTIGGHSEAVNVEFERPITAEEATKILRSAPGVLVVDDPHMPRGLRSRPFDGEGLATSARNISGVAAPVSTSLRALRSKGSLRSIASISSTVR